MARFRITSAVICLSVFASFGCSSSDGGGGGGSTSGGTSGGGAGGTLTTGGSGGTASGGSSGAGGSACAKGPGYPSTDPSHQVDELNATILDTTGAPATKVLAQVCGLDLCINGSTDNQGVVCTLDKQTSVCAPGILPNAEFRRPAFKYGDGMGYVKFAQLLPTNTTKYAIGEVRTAKLPDPSQGVTLVPGGSASSGGATLTLAAGTDITFDELTFDTDELKKFRAAEVPLSSAPPAVDKSAGFEIIVGTTPLDTEFCPHAKLSVKNTASWAAGTEVEFWIHGIDPGEEWAPYAGWAKVSGGKVTSDGQSVETNDGEGIPVLSTFGIKKK
ncbi:MAG: hypothetical protein IPI67_12590 [Myxococcales bacterium]|nr:hypothetical protein [Myxococcales bacterium]